jgi:hypothetical protein
MCIDGYHRARIKKYMAIHPARMIPPTVKTKPSVTGSGGSFVGSMLAL